MDISDCEGDRKDLIVGNDTQGRKESPILMWKAWEDENARWLENIQLTFFKMCNFLKGTCKMGSRSIFSKSLHNLLDLKELFWIHIKSLLTLQNFISTTRSM